MDNRQYGFLSQRSVDGCQPHFFETITAAYDAGHSIVTVYLDIQKAFHQFITFASGTAFPSSCKASRFILPFLSFELRHCPVWTTWLAVIHSTRPVIYNHGILKRAKKPCDLISASFHLVSPVGLDESRCPKNCTPQPNHLKCDVRYGAVKKLEHVRPMMARHCLTQFDSTPATIPFLLGTTYYARLHNSDTETEHELAFRKVRNCCNSEIRRVNIQKQATILDLAPKYENVKFSCTSHRRGMTSSRQILPRRGYERPLTTSSLRRRTVVNSHKRQIRSRVGADEVHPKILKVTSFTLAKHVYLVFRDFNAPKAPRTELQCVGSSEPFTAALTEVVQQSAWTQHVVAPTRYRAGQQPSLLDLVITNERHFVDQSMDYETRLAVLDLFPLEYRRLRGDLTLTYALFEQGLANRSFTVDPANTRRGHGERQLLNDKNKTDPGNLGDSLAPVYQSVNP
ncbi:hypothetical protein CLF_110007 [Clonorchis sinensis]|uniref:Reverse transcriptase domain-containing protein n=1 Tax=Clonorchis sinensis TaxID=79923 RepID=G7YT36_CLOSI|nr:hypothetical protein CLF_110007 [Clonorchis sinensis]